MRNGLLSAARIRARVTSGRLLVHRVSLGTNHKLAGCPLQFSPRYRIMTLKLPIGVTCNRISEANALDCRTKLRVGPSGAMERARGGQSLPAARVSARARAN